VPGPPSIPSSREGDFVEVSNRPSQRVSRAAAIAVPVATFVSSKRVQRTAAIAAPVVAAVVVMALLKPVPLIYGLQAGGLYAVAALPLAVALGIVGILNLSHGALLMMGGYFAFWASTLWGVNPLISVIPLAAVFFLIGILLYRATIKPVLRATLFSQLLLTFGLYMVFQELANLLWRNNARQLYLPFSSSSATIGSITFGTSGFIYLGAAIALVVGLVLFFRRTKTGQAAIALGQNPRGAQLCGINTDRIYLLIFSLTVAITGAIGGLYVVRYAIFPGVGMSYNLKGLCLIAVAGEGNLGGIVWFALLLGVAESLIRSFPGYGGWANVVFFALLIAGILIKTQRERRR
jgi:branched-chain amino acid transport system permease protein